MPRRCAHHDGDRLGRDRGHHENFDAEAYLAAVEKFHATHSQLVPTMFVRLLKLPAEIRAKYTFSLRGAIHAAAPCPVEIKQQMIDWWVRS